MNEICWVKWANHVWFQSEVLSITLTHTNVGLLGLMLFGVETEHRRSFYSTVFPVYRLGNKTDLFSSGFESKR